MDIVQEVDGGTVAATYLTTLNIDEPLARLTPNASRLYQTDALGSVIALTDEAGAIKKQYVYDPFGNVTISGEASDNPLQYTGRENDGTGLYYYRARYYSPELQRFISEDPIGFVGGPNLYSYLANNTVNFVDPLGLWGIGIIGSESTEAGIVIIGVGQTGSIGGGIFWEGLFKKINLGGFATWGGLAGGPGYGYCTGDDKKGNFIAGAFGGGGGGIFITNAKRASDLSGPAKTFSFNAGWGKRVLSIQLTVSKGGTWILSYGGPLPYVPVTGGGYGISVSYYNTNTRSTK